MASELSLAIALTCAMWFAFTRLTGQTLEVSIWAAAWIAFAGWMIAGLQTAPIPESSGIGVSVLGIGWLMAMPPVVMLLAMAAMAVRGVKFRPLDAGTTVDGVPDESWRPDRWLLGSAVMTSAAVIVTEPAMEMLARRPSTCNADTADERLIGVGLVVMAWMLVAHETRRHRLITAWACVWLTIHATFESHYLVHSLASLAPSTGYAIAHLMAAPALMATSVIAWRRVRPASKALATPVAETDSESPGLMLPPVADVRERRMPGWVTGALVLGSGISFASESVQQIFRFG